MIFNLTCLYILPPWRIVSSIYRYNWKCCLGSMIHLKNLLQEINLILLHITNSCKFYNKKLTKNKMRFLFGNSVFIVFIRLFFWLLHTHTNAHHCTFIFPMGGHIICVLRVWSLLNLSVRSLPLWRRCSDLLEASHCNQQYIRNHQ
jgi:hypothetical protein